MHNYLYFGPLQGIGVDCIDIGYWHRDTNEAHHQVTTNHIKYADKENLGLGSSTRTKIDIIVKKLK